MSQIHLKSWCCTDRHRIWWCFSCTIMPFKILCFDFDSLPFVVCFQTLASVFSCLSQAKSFGTCIYWTPNHIQGFSVTWQRIKLTSLKPFPIYSTKMGIKVHVADFVLQSIRHLEMFLIEDSDITLFTNWEHCLFDWLMKSCWKPVHT